MARVWPGSVITVLGSGGQICIHLSSLFLMLCAKNYDKKPSYRWEKPIAPLTWSKAQRSNSSHGEKAISQRWDSFMHVMLTEHCLKS